MKTQRWYDKDGRFHREDGPAIIYPDRTERWYKNGEYHREDGPAVIDKDVQMWFLNGKLHRIGKPAAIYSDVAQYWFLNGKFHCEDGPAISLKDGTKRYFLDGIEYNLISYIKKLVNIPSELDKCPLILADWLEENNYEKLAKIIREKL